MPNPRGLFPLHSSIFSLTSPSLALARPIFALLAVNFSFVFSNELWVPLFLSIYLPLVPFSLSWALWSGPDTLLRRLGVFSGCLRALPGDLGAPEELFGSSWGAFGSSQGPPETVSERLWSLPRALRGAFWSSEEARRREAKRRKALQGNQELIGCAADARFAEPGDLSKTKKMILKLKRRLLPRLEKSLEICFRPLSTAKT